MRDLLLFDDWAWAKWRDGWSDEISDVMASYRIGTLKKIGALDTFDDRLDGRCSDDASKPDNGDAKGFGEMHDTFFRDCCCGC